MTDESSLTPIFTATTTVLPPQQQQQSAAALLGTQLGRASAFTKSSRAVRRGFCRLD